MQHKNTVCFASLIALLLMLFLQMASYADTYIYNRATSNGVCQLDGVNGTGIFANVYMLDDVTTGVTQTAGTLKILSYNLSANSYVVSQFYTRITIGGVNYKHVKITGSSFTYNDYVRHTACLAHIVMELTQYGPHGQGGFQIIRDADGTVVAQSAPNGTYTEVPFVVGSVSII